MKADLIRGGYPNDDELLCDEIHAYLATSFDDELAETFPDIPLSELRPYIDRLKAIP
jgi:hypothetical protein